MALILEQRGFFRAANVATLSFLDFRNRQENHSFFTSDRSENLLKPVQKSRVFACDPAGFRSDFAFLLAAKIEKTGPIFETDSDREPSIF